MCLDPFAIAEPLNRLPFVRWDRLVRGAAENDSAARYVNVYGWIDRSDGRADFVYIEFATWLERPYFVTSSADRSVDIAEMLYGKRAHGVCERVEDVLPGVERVIRLEGSRGR